MGLGTGGPWNKIDSFFTTIQLLSPIVDSTPNQGASLSQEATTLPIKEGSQFQVTRASLALGEEEWSEVFQALNPYTSYSC